MILATALVAVGAALCSLGGFFAGVRAERWAVERHRAWVAEVERQRRAREGFESIARAGHEGSAALTALARAYRDGWPHAGDPT